MGGSVKIGRNHGIGVVFFVCGLMLCMMGHLGPQGVDAWGGLFNRFSPEMLANMGYGGNGYSQPAYLQVSD